jgi:ABC-type bacteriocin/lantibiotic exporter with double-glycine peptidase domain
MGYLGILIAIASLLPVPFVAQQGESCGAASLAMVMRYHGVPTSQDVIASALLDDELQGIRGSRLAEWARAAGFFALAYQGDMEQLRDFVAKRRPLIVALESTGGRFHDVVVVGWDSEHREVIVNDPALGPERRIPESLFDARWERSGRWTLLVLPASAAHPAP